MIIVIRMVSLLQIYFGLANDWVKLFISLEGKRKGYEKKRVTSYMHCLVYYMPFLSSLHLGLMMLRFSGQGMDKANYIAKSIHHQHSNKIDACANILKGSMRRLQLKHMQRESREYSKRNLVYWHEDVFKKIQIIEHSSELEHSREENPAEELSVSDVNDKLKYLGSKLGSEMNKNSKKKVRALISSYVHLIDDLHVCDL